MSQLLKTGAFVIHFRRGTSFASGTMQGRIEHVASGWSACFDSRQQFLDRLAQAFDQVESESTETAGVRKPTEE
ncbi:MAG TPA: hypothetical protein VFB92_16475 [Vicinamibacterales bacterium]|jgi:hypothetical protein|nr:hypothetical protein [Vicinamibacterales bacterium]